MSEPLVSPRDRVAAFFAERTARRGLALSLFIGLLVLFRHLALVLVAFVSFERLLFLTAGALERRFKWRRLWGLCAVLSVAAIGLGGLTWFSAGRMARLVTETRDTLPERIATVREHPWFLMLRDHLPDSEDLVKSAETYAQDVARSAAAIGRAVLSVVIGLILAIVYFLDEERIRAFRKTLSPGSLVGTLSRWLEHLAESVSLTVQLQLVVATCNALLTLPVLLIIGVTHVPALMLLIFLSGLIPVVGNLISGAVLVVLAFQAKGWVGVVIFVVLTFLLHKVESYYLNPRLAARHVALPSFVLILSLLAWEHLLGFVGLFVSFPFLYMVGQIRAEFAQEDAPPLPAVVEAETAVAATAPPK